MPGAQCTLAYYKNMRNTRAQCTLSPTKTFKFTMPKAPRKFNINATLAVFFVHIAYTMSTMRNFPLD